MVCRDSTNLQVHVASGSVPACMVAMAGRDAVQTPWSVCRCCFGTYLALGHAQKAMAQPLPGPPVFLLQSQNALWRSVTD